jgi:uncharacterized protein YprB with RNaseH-like and TPR domain
MLRNTFRHIPGIGPKTERDLWDAGFTSWQALLDGNTARTVSRRSSCLEHLCESVEHYDAGDPAYFAERLPAPDQWRYFADFRRSCAYVDIETTGMVGHVDEVTTVCLYDGKRIRTYVRGDNLEDFPNDLAAYRVLVTYNGRCFDVPFLERCFGIRVRQAHIDLRYVLKAVGVSGGLKRCERQLGLRRDGLEEVDGYMAVLLWREYRRGRDPRALETLLAYNVQDTVNLETLLVKAHNLHVAGTPFAASHRLPEAGPPANPHTPDADLVRRFAAAGPWVVSYPR